MQKMTLTVRQTACLMGVPDRAVYRAVHSGEIAVMRLGKRLLVLKEPLERLLAGTSGASMATEVD